MDIQKTINYFQFKQLDSNREPDKKHVEKIRQKIRKKNLLHLFPILVDSQFNVIDGRHRLAAAELEKEYIYFFVDDTISKSDMADINSASKNWNINDYINYWTVEQREGFDVFSQFMLDNPLIPPSTVLMMMSKDSRSGLKGIREGIIDVSNLDHAQQVSGILKEYSELIHFAYERNFVLAVLKCLNNPAYSHSHMQSKLEYQSRSLRRCVSVKQYCEMLTDIYNHSMSAKNHIKISG